MEAQLFEQFFPSSSSASTTNAMNQPVGGSSSQPTPLSPSALAAAERLVMVMEPLCTILYDVLRPLVVHLQDVDELCELVDILKHEVLGDQLNRKGPGAEALSPTLGRTLADVQSRLIYRSQAFIKDEVSSYQPTLPDDLDYPAKLIRAREAEAKVEGEGEGAEVPSSLPPASLLPLMYPPVQSTLVCLSKLYRAVDVRTFGGLAQEAISACTLSIQQAARQVAQRSGPLDAQVSRASLMSRAPSLPLPLFFHLFHTCPLHVPHSFPPSALHCEASPLLEGADRAIWRRRVRLLLHRPRLFSPP